MKKLLTAILLVSAMGCETTDLAEKSIELKSIMPMVRLAPFPSAGIVKTNSPNFIWSPVIKEKTGKNSYDFDENYHYRIRISRDPDFQGQSTIESDKLEWTFFIPHKKLEKGTWYWQYASESLETGEFDWSETIEFEITGNEREFVIPSPKEFINKIPRTHPKFLTTK